jgi:hypothetical protein
MDDSAPGTYRVPSGVGIGHARCDAGQGTSDGGLLWLAEAERAVGVCDALAARVPEWRTRRGVQSRAVLVRQRVWQIACGSRDQPDASTLRHDPRFKVVCDRLPEGDPDLASQPTLSRLDNAVDRRRCSRLAAALLEVYRRERERHGRPTHLVLDLDGTDDPTHGEQEGSAYQGYYGQHR